MNLLLLHRAYDSTDTIRLARIVLATLVCLLAVAGASAQARDDRVRLNATPEQKCSQHFFWLEDKSAQATFAEVSSGTLAGEFKPSGGKTLSNDFGLTDSAIWLRIRLAPAERAPRTWLLEIANPLLDRADLYVQTDAGDYQHQAGGDTVPQAAGQIAHRHPVFPVQLRSAGTTTIYLRAASHGTVSLPITLWQQPALWAHDQATYASLSLYFGLTAALLIYNLMLYLATRERAYLFYVGFIAAMGMYQVTLTGLGAQSLWPGSLYWNARSPPVFVALSASLALLFTRDFLATCGRMPRIDVALRTQILGWLAVIPFSLLSSGEVSVRAATISAGVTIASMIVAGVVSARRGQREARIFLFAWAALFVGAGVLVLYMNGLAPSRPFTIYALLIGSAVEMILLSLALADKINQIRIESEYAESARRREEELAIALGQSQEKYRQIIDRMGEGIVVVQGREVVFVNECATDILARARDELIGGDLIDRFAADLQGPLLAALAQAQTGVLPPPVALAVAQGGEPERVLEVAFARIPWDERGGVLVFFHDITARMLAEDNARKALNSLHELNDLRSRFVAVTSHEFRTPLAAMLSSQELLLYYRQRLSVDERRAQLQNIGTGVQRMTAMLARSLESDDVAQRLGVCQPQRMDVAGLCESLVAEQRMQYPGMTCTVRLKLAGSLHDVSGDERLLRHIFGNLLSNALKYSPAGGEVVLSGDIEGETLVFVVSDQGIGIPANDLPHLFEPFHRAANVAGIPGTGLGMSIIKQAVELHGGHISVSSELGKGSRFVVCLPGAR